MKIRIIMMFILLSSMAYGAVEKEEFDITTYISVYLHDNRVDLSTESGDYSYDCNANVTHNKSVDFEREFEIDVDDIGCDANLDYLASICTEVSRSCNTTIGSLEESLKDSRSYAEKYNECINEKEKLQNEQGYQEKYNTCNTDLSAKSSELTICNTDRDNARKERDDCLNSANSKNVEINDLKQEKTYWGVGGLIIGALAVYYFFVYNKQGKSKRERAGLDEGRGRIND